MIPTWYHRRIAGPTRYDALHIAFLFNVINRLADTFGASYEGEAGRRLTAAGLYRMGYQVPGFLLR